MLEVFNSVSKAQIVGTCIAATLSYRINDIINEYYDELERKSKKRCILSLLKLISTIIVLYMIFIIID